MIPETFVIQHWHCRNMLGASRTRFSRRRIADDLQRVQCGGGLGSGVCGGELGHLRFAEQARNRPGHSPFVVEAEPYLVMGRDPPNARQAGEVFKGHRSQNLVVQTAKTAVQGGFIVRRFADFGLREHGIQVIDVRRRQK
ncbi:MAG: hypothetical protein U0992_04680 [Planctomycetaceae bacterium]